MLQISTFIVTILLLMLSLQACGTDPSVSTASPVTTSQVTHPSSPSHDDIQKWVSQANSYVHIVNYIATINPQIYKDLTSHITDFVQQAVKHYNGLSLALRKFGIASPTSLSPAPPDYASVSYSSQNDTSSHATVACPQSHTITPNWWGVTIHMNHCLASDTGNGLAVSSGITAGLSLFGIDAPLDAFSGILAAYSGAIFLADTHCGDNGANLDVSWVVVSWVTPIC